MTGSSDSSRVIDVIRRPLGAIPNLAIDRVDARPARAWVWLHSPIQMGMVPFYGTYLFTSPLFRVMTHTKDHFERMATTIPYLANHGDGDDDDSHSLMRM